MSVGFARHRAVIGAVYAARRLDRGDKNTALGTTKYATETSPRETDYETS